MNPSLEFFFVAYESPQFGDCLPAGDFWVSSSSLRLPARLPLLRAQLDIRRHCDLSSPTMGWGKTGARTLI